MDIRRATGADVPGITVCVCEAYVHYIERIGKRPGPMLEDFDETVAHDITGLRYRDPRADAGADFERTLRARRRDLATGSVVVSDTPSNGYPGGMGSSMMRLRTWRRTAPDASAALAASAATQGWQMPIRCEPGPMRSRKRTR